MMSKSSNNTTNARSSLLFLGLLPCFCSSRSSSYSNAHQFMPPTSLCRCHLTPHVAEQVVLSSSKVLLGSRSWRGWCAFADRAGMAPSAKLFLLLRNGRGSVSLNRTGVVPATKVVILHRLWCLNRLRLGWRRSGSWCRIRLRPSIVVAPWVAVGPRN
jgi:hypothetical protein